MKKLTRILVTCLMILSLSVTAFAAELPKGASERGYSFYYRDGEDGIIETPLEGEITVAHHPAIDSAISARGVYTYTVTQTSKGLEMSRNVQSGNTQNLKSSAAPVRLPAAPASTPGTSQAAAQAGCVYRP